MKTLVVFALAFPHPASASVITSAGGPLTSIDVSSTLNCDVRYLGDSSPEWFGGTACATLLAVDGTLYGPASIPAGSGAAQTAFGAMHQSAVSGTGSATDPYRVETEVSAGSTGVRVIQVDTYVGGQEFYRTDVQVLNDAGSIKDVRVYRAGDCYLGNSDFGYGRVSPDSGAVACTGAQSDDSRIEQWYPLTTGSTYFESQFGNVWRQLATREPLPNSCECTSLLDNGVALSWGTTLAAGGRSTLSSLNAFSPVGREPIELRASATPENVITGRRVRYTVNATNLNPGRATLDSLVVRLPLSARYVAGSASGELTGGPAEQGGTLTFSPAGSVQSGQTYAGSFDVVYSEPGEMSADVSAVSSDASFIPVIDTAVVHVRTPDAPPPPGAFEIIAPDEGAGVQPGALYVSWTASPGASSYVVQVDGETEASTRGTDASFEVDAGEHELQVVAANGSGVSRSPTRHFHVLSGARAASGASGNEFSNRSFTKTPRAAVRRHVWPTYTGHGSSSTNASTGARWTRTLFWRRAGTVGA